MGWNEQRKHVFQQPLQNAKIISCSMNKIDEKKWGEKGEVRWAMRKGREIHLKVFHPPADVQISGLHRLAS